MDKQWVHTRKLQPSTTRSHTPEPYARIGDDNRCATCGDVIEEFSRPTFVTQEHLDYLDNLRKSGDTNMFGAGAYLVSEFGLAKVTARDVLQYWMKTFGQEGR